MKKIILFLTMTLPMIAISQNDDLCPDDRKVIQETADLWLTSFEKSEFIEGDGPIVLSAAMYKQYFPNTLGGTSTCTSLVFWYYMNESEKLKIAIEVNSSQFLVYNKNGEHTWSIVDSEYMDPRVSIYRKFLNAGTKPLAYVLQYRFNRQNIDRMFYVNNASNITIENVLHSVSPDTERYQMPTEYNGHNVSGLEGVQAFDILIRYDVANEIQFHNFAMPCPRNCPK